MPAVTLKVKNWMASLSGAKISGTAWRFIFIAATILAILALTALLYNIINGSFGAVVTQFKVDPASLVLDLGKEQLIAAPNTVSSEDDNELVAGIEDDPYAIGFRWLRLLQR